MKTGVLQQQPLHNFASVRSAPTQRHGAQIWRSVTPEADKIVVASAEEKSFKDLLER